MENEEKIKKRELTDAPGAVTASGIKSWLVERGARGVLSANAVSAIVGVSLRTVKNAERSGELKAIDKCTYTLDGVVGWLQKHPRYVSQGLKYWEVTENTIPKVKGIVQRTCRRMIQLWNGDVDDLVAEICFKMSKMAVSSPVSEETVIFRAINNLWHDKQTQNMAHTVSLDELQEKGVLKDYE